MGESHVATKHVYQGLCRSFRYDFKMINFYLNNYCLFFINTKLGEVIDHDLMLHSSYEWLNKVTINLLYYKKNIINIYILITFILSTQNNFN